MKPDIMKKKTVTNFFISTLILGIYFGFGYYFFENHSMLQLVSYRKVALFSVYYSLLAGFISMLYALTSKQGWNAFLYMNTLQMNFCLSIGVFGFIAEYGMVFMRGKILLYSVAVIAMFVLQLFVFFAQRKKSREIPAPIRK